MANKIKSTLFGIIFIAFALIFVANASAQTATCPATYRLTYAPEDLVSEMDFNATFTDIEGNVIGQNVWFDYSVLTLVSGSNPQIVQDMGGFGQAKWVLNAPSGGNYNISVIVPYNSTSNCTIVKNISIAPYSSVGTPNVTVTMSDWTTTMTSRNLQDYPLTYNNIGNGTAVNVTTLFSYISPSGLFSYSRPSFDLDAGDSETLNYALNNSLCGAYRIDTTTTYKNNLGNLMDPVLASDEFNVSGADLQITQVYVPQTTYYNGQTINAVVSITNNNRTLNGIIPADASNVTVYFDDYRCSTLGSISINGVQNFSCNYRISESFSSTRVVNYVVKVQGDNDCMNYASLSNYKSRTVPITVRISGSSGGGGGSGGSGGGSTYVAICGNKICEAGENTANCAIDCGQTTPTTPGQIGTTSTSNEQGLYIYSNDGKAFVYVSSGTKIFMDRMPVLNPRDWIIVKLGNITTKLPYGVSMIRQYEFIPNGLEFIPDSTISFKYDQWELKNGVYLMYFDSDEQKWIFIDAVVDADNHLISSRVEHFSNYALVTKENYPLLTGFVLIDSVIGFVSQNILLDMIILGVVILIVLTLVFFLNRKDKKKRKK